MKALLFKLTTFEILCATYLGTFGEWWAACAARRLGKFSPNSSGDDQ